MEEIVGRLPIAKFVWMFIIYIIIHIAIGKYNEKTKLDLKKKPDDKELISQSKLLEVAFKWFPAVYLIIILMVLYF